MHPISPALHLRLLKESFGSAGRDSLVPAAGGPTKLCPTWDKVSSSAPQAGPAPLQFGQGFQRPFRTRGSTYGGLGTPSLANIRGPSGAGRVRGIHRAPVLN